MQAVLLQLRDQGGGLGRISHTNPHGEPFAVAFGEVGVLLAELGHGESSVVGVFETDLEDARAHDLLSSEGVPSDAMRPLARTVTRSAS